MKRPVCVIDDDEDVRAVMCFALEFEGIQTIAFESAYKATEYLLTLPLEEMPCLIIVDYMMPDMDGIDFIKEAHAKYPDSIGTIAMALSTARLSEETDELPAGAVLLPKPLDLTQLISLAKKHYFTSPEDRSSL